MHESNLKQSVLSTSKGDVEVIRLHRKEYLQPFEDELAIRELEGLGFDVVSYDHRTNLFNIRKVKTEEGERKLSRLAYFDWVINDHFNPSLQSCREGTSVNATPDHPSFHKRRKLRFGPHDFHEYRGKFFPQLVRSLCNIAGLEEESIVLDPMCGSGTTLVEARAIDMNALGIDMNPLSVLISDVKTNSVGWDIQKIRCMREDIEKTLEIYSSFSLPWEEKDRLYLKKWFEEEALQDIASLLTRFQENGDKNLCKFAYVCLSDILRMISHQKMDDLRVRKEYHTYHSGEAFRLFRRRVEDTLTSVQNLICADSGNNVNYDVQVGDSRSPETVYNSVMGRVDAIITSPPYATALPYLDTDRLSLIVLGLLPRANHKSVELNMIGSREITETKRQAIWKDYLERKQELPSDIVALIDKLALVYHRKEVGFRRRNKPALLARYFFDMKKVLEGMYRMLRSGSTAFVVIGNNSTRIDGQRIDIQTDEFLAQLAKSVKFEVQFNINMELLVSRDIFRNNRGTREKILCLVKA